MTPQNGLCAVGVNRSSGTTSCTRELPGQCHLHPVPEVVVHEPDAELVVHLRPLPRVGLRQSVHDVAQAFDQALEVGGERTPPDG